jgi:cellulose biosynthesis protein BcsQ
MANRIATATLAGGQGKSSLASALAMDLNFYLISNDDNIIGDVYEGALITKTPQIVNEVVYDFGGFESPEVVDIMKVCDVLIVPCINDKTAIRKANQTIEELSPYVEDIIVVATRVRNKRDLAAIKDGVILDEVLPMRDTKLFKDCQEFGVGVYTLAKHDNKLRYAYRNVILEYDALLARIMGKKEAEALKQSILGDN